VKQVRQIIRKEMFADPARREQFQKYLLIAGPILGELADLGYEVETLDDLRHQGKPWETAIPVLLRWLPKIDDLDLKDSIVRGLSVPWTGNKATAALIEEFKNYAPNRDANPWIGKQLRALSDEEIKASRASSFAWAVGNALSIVDVKGFEKQLIELCRNAKYGTARQMLVLGLGRFRNSDAEDAALELLNDEDVRLHAIIALGKMKSKRALFELERLLTDKKATIRKEARKAIIKITR